MVNRAQIQTEETVRKANRTLLSIQVGYNVGQFWEVQIVTT